MISEILITICALLLLAYIFDLSASRTRIPSVILLLFLGWGLKTAAEALAIEIPSLSPILPVLGTIGLILIVLDGALEVELKREKFGILGKAALGALLSALVLSVGLGYVFHVYGALSLKDSITNAVPLAVISSAIAIPTARSLSPAHREFIIYESSLSDIFGVVIFNFMVVNEVINGSAFVEFTVDILIMAFVALVATVALSLFLNRITHPIKFIPIMVLVVLIYAVSKLYHLPSLLFILVFGLFLGNTGQIRSYKWAKRMRWDELNLQVTRFHEIVAELAFLVRALFFLVFGFTLSTIEIIDLNTLPWSVGIVLGVLLVRAFQLRLSGLPMSPLLYIAPRGLITILLFLSIPSQMLIPLVNQSLLTQVILLSALVMIIGMFTVEKTPVAGKETGPPAQAVNGSIQEPAGIPAPEDSSS